jgi:hypothetical protein
MAGTAQCSVARTRREGTACIAEQENSDNSWLESYLNRSHPSIVCFKRKLLPADCTAGGNRHKMLGSFSVFWHLRRDRWRILYKAKLTLALFQPFARLAAALHRLTVFGKLRIERAYGF